MPASTLQPMTEVANPVMARAAVSAQAGERAVITTRAARMSKASAKVSTIRTPRRSISASSRLRYVIRRSSASSSSSCSSADAAATSRA